MQNISFLLNPSFMSIFLNLLIFQTNSNLMGGSKKSEFHCFHDFIFLSIFSNNITNINFSSCQPSHLFFFGHSKGLDYFLMTTLKKLGVLIYLTIIPRVRVGYEVIDSQRGAKRQVGYNHLISNKCEWNNCFIKNHQQRLLDFADFAWLEQPEGNLMDAISWVWYTIAVKPIKTLELHYTMIQFVIIENISGTPPLSPPAWVKQQLTSYN